MSETKVTIHASGVDNELPPYDWKKKPINMPQGTTIEKMVAMDTIRQTWDMLTVADIFAMTFVAKGLREMIIDRLKKTKYITHRARQILLVTLEASLGDATRDFLEIMRDHKLYIGGSSILHGIMYDRPDVIPWQGSDIDSYVKSDAEFKLMREDMNMAFEHCCNVLSDDSLERKYAGWWYGKWCGKNENIDVVSTQHGIECYDFTACQNSIDWEGRMRYASIH